MTREHADKTGMEILGKFIGCAVVGGIFSSFLPHHKFTAPLDTGVEPKHMGVGPIVAIPKVLEQVGLSKEDIDVWEANTDIQCHFIFIAEQWVNADKRGFCFTIRILCGTAANPNREN